MSDRQNGGIAGMNILITSIGNKVNLVKYFRRALFNEGTGMLFGSDIDPLVPTRSFLDRLLCSPPSDSPLFPEWLVEQVKSHQVRLIIPSRDEDLPQLARLKKLLHADYHCRVMVAEPDVIDICLDKSRFYYWCARHGFAYPEVLEKEQVKQQDLPLFVKPKTGSGSRYVYPVQSWQQWQDVKQDLGDDFLVQRFVSGQEYTLDVFVGQAGKVLSVVPRARLKTQHGESVHSRVELDQQLIKLATQLAEQLNLVGHNTIQCFKQQGEVLFSEVNARFGGGFTLGVEAGADTPRYLLREQKSLAPLNDHLSLQDGLEMRRIHKDLFYAAKKSKVFCFDLDGTICSENCPYEQAQPMPLIVEKINLLFQQGHTIIIATARGAASQTCWRELTEKQLNEWGVQYHELITSKPYADVYIDNKALDVLEFI